MSNKFSLLAMAVMMLMAFGGFAAAQSPQSVSNGERPGPAAPPPELLRELALSPEQIEAIKRINRERRPAHQDARARFLDAERALNIAIYSDSLNEAEFRTRLGEFQQAQAELARVKFSSELAIRKILTPNQLMRFRELRRQFAESRDFVGPGGRGRGGRPGLRRIRPNGRPFN